MSVRVGVLSLQGDFREHVVAMSELDCDSVAVKTVHDVLSCDGLIIPGGESTTIGKLCDRFGVGDAIRELHARGKPIWGTCAGAILLAKEIVESDQWRLGLMDIEVARNAFGRQVDSFETDLECAEIDGGPVRAVFIRAPYITRVFGDARALSVFRDRIVMARQGTLLASAFHPELTSDRRVQQYFLDMVNQARE
ncbi:MAG: pyridoxal 5'-phosphate synthase glutaminase subunit PdxT [Armatimonadetes bacterium]|nr:pyridoxal 5'-phosphate synthase glutaminase subunit PdxT [Armatimonadota bacterium]